MPVNHGYKRGKLSRQILDLLVIKYHKKAALATIYKLPYQIWTFHQTGPCVESSLTILAAVQRKKVHDSPAEATVKLLSIMK